MNTTAANAMVMHHLDYARALCASTVAARSLHVVGMEREDWLQEAYVGLVEASRKHAAAQGSFRSYAHRRVVGSLLDAARRYNSCKGSTYRRLRRLGRSIPKVACLEDGNLVAGRERRHDLDPDLIGRLSPLCQRLLCLIYERDLSLAEAGAELGLTKQKAHSLLHRSLDRLRTNLHKLGLE